MEFDLNLPLARGCSEFLPSMTTLLRSNSFIMTYYQYIAMSTMSLVYDHEFSYMRKEMSGRSIRIWDLNEDLVYHIDPRGTSQLFDNETKVSVDLTPCSVLRVLDDKLGPADKPYESKSIVVAEFLGVSMITYVGQGKVRDFPCFIYERVMEEPPKIFGLNTEMISRTGGNFDYIVQYYLLRQNQITPNTNLHWNDLISDAEFWPARIVLYKRNKKTGQTVLFDQLEISDFHWGLMGWNKKPSEMFMASQCFDDEDEQVRMELAIEFDGLRSDTDRRLLVHNKFKLEVDLLNQITQLLQITRLHLVEFEFNLRPRHVLLNLVIGDRTLDKNLTYYGEGQLPREDSYLSNRIVLRGLGEQSCLATASLVRDISMVFYCPDVQSFDNSKCTAIFGGYEPTFTVTKSDKLNDSFTGSTACQVYRFSYIKPPRLATAKWQQWKDVIRGHKLTFKAETSDGGHIDFNGQIEDLDISCDVKLLTISHYKFAIEKIEDNSKQENKGASENGHDSDSKWSQDSIRKVRYFDSMSYDNVGDCTKMCNLDAACKSYSYCPPTESNKNYNDPTSCILSSLDIRAAKVDEQLVKLMVKDNVVTVNGTQELSLDTGSDKQYNLELTSNCVIYERDYLNMFTLSDEVIRLDASLANHFRSMPSSFECAKWASELEENYPEHHVAMFAYCADSNTCLLDENLFIEMNNNSQTNGVDEDDDNNDSDIGQRTELQCSIYRRRYQTYFHVSPRVWKRQLKVPQLELALNTVEECARACWNKFGHVCSSFDYCWPQACLINMIPDDADNSVKLDIEFETRTDCLHYERDLRLDKIRQEHMIGRHQVLKLNQNSSAGLVFAKLFTHVLLFCLILIAFVAGLAVGRQINDRLENVTILRQSFSAGSSGLRRASQMFGFSRLQDGSMRQLNKRYLGSGDEIQAGADSNDPRSIQMEPIRRVDEIEEQGHKVTIHKQETQQEQKDNSLIEHVDSSYTDKIGPDDDAPNVLI